MGKTPILLFHLAVLFLAEMVEDSVVVTDIVDQDPTAQND